MMGQFDFSTELKVQLDGLVHKMSMEHRAEALALIDDMARITQQGIASGDMAAAGESLRFVVSSLKSLASIAASEAEKAIKDALILVTTRAIQIMLAAAAAV